MLADKFEQARALEYQHKNDLYGISLSNISNELDGEASINQVIEAFIKLNSKCQLLIILKHNGKLSHREIIEMIEPFYDIKNEVVSRNQLARCKKSWEKNILEVLGGHER